MVVFDEFPSTSLLDEKGAIDAKRYPAFARLAKDATFFKNAHSVYDSTSRAVPAIMDGNLPGDRQAPADRLRAPQQHLHPARQEPHDERVRGGHQRLPARPVRGRAPRRAVRRPAELDDRGPRASSTPTWSRRPASRSDLPTVSESWGDFGGGGEGGGARRPRPANGDQPDTRANLASDRKGRFDEWIGDDPRQARPTLNFKHALLPHVPWQYLPDGRQYRRDGHRADPPDLAPELQGPGPGRPAPAAPPAADRLRRPRARQDARRGSSERGLYDDALIVVVADHGVSFKKGQFDRRDVNREQHRRDHARAAVRQAAGPGQGAR